MNGKMQKYSGQKSMSFHSIVLLCLLLFCAGETINAQVQEDDYASEEKSAKKKKAFDLDRVIVGGGFGLQFGTVTLVEVSPTIGYLITDNLLAGIGGRYIYYEENYLGSSYQTNIYGGNAFTQYFFTENLLGHVEYEMLNLESGFAEANRINISSLFVGGGYRSSLGGNSFASILVLYNLNDDINSPYTNPVIRIGFGFGL